VRWWFKICLQYSFCIRHIDVIHFSQVTLTTVHCSKCNIKIFR
jgi:hypothetical protein